MPQSFSNPTLFAQHEEPPQFNLVIWSFNGPIINEEEDFSLWNWRGKESDEERIKGAVVIEEINQEYLDEVEQQCDKSYLDIVWYYC